MLIEIHRHTFTEHSTIGEMFINGNRHCYTLEDHWPEDGVKIPGETCIPAGAYQVILNQSPKFGHTMPRLLNVPGFDGILIHKGNTDADTHGCVLVGAQKSADRIFNCSDVWQNLFDQMQLAQGMNENILCVISNEPGEAFHA